MEPNPACPATRPRHILTATALEWPALKCSVVAAFGCSVTITPGSPRKYPFHFSSRALNPSGTFVLIGQAVAAIDGSRYQRPRANATWYPSRAAARFGEAGLHRDPPEPSPGLVSDLRG